MRLCVIPARGGSKRIPKKNIRDFCGRPIIAYSIKTAISSDLFDEVIVSTDDEVIAEVATKYGATVPFFRPRNLSDDHTGTARVVKHAVEWYKRERDNSVEIACCIYATAPFLRTTYLREGSDVLESGSSDFSFSATSFPFPIQRSIRIMQPKGVEPIFPEHILARSQDLQEAYHDAGQFYWGTTEAWLKERPLFSDRSDAVLIPRHLVQDIDTLEDWKRAELMYRALQLADEH